MRPAAKNRERHLRLKERGRRVHRLHREAGGGAGGRAGGADGGRPGAGARGHAADGVARRDAGDQREAEAAKVLPGAAARAGVRVDNWV